MSKVHSIAKPEWLQALGSLKDVIANVVSEDTATIIIKDGDERVDVIRKIAGQLLHKIQHEFVVMDVIPSMGRVSCRKFVCHI
jgi:hypothetical protein